MSVTVISGANEDDFPLAGRPVEYARDFLAATWNIPTDAQATVNDRTAVAGTILNDGDELVFARTQAEKGC